LRTEIELREHYGASRNTVRDAIKRLTTLGLVEPKPGLGTFVVQTIDPFVTTLTSDPSGAGFSEGAAYLSEVNRKAASSPPQVEIQEASDGMATAPRIANGAEVISRHERRFIDGTPWSMQTSYYPM
jgi:GntR family transcriptional regulator